MVKKWTIAVFGLFIALTGFFVFRYVTMGRDDYLRAAENMEKNGKYSDILITLNKALDKSRETYGEISVETAEVYRRLGNKEQDLKKAAEYFDKAALIYELEGQPEQIPAVKYEKGYMLLHGHEETADQAKEAFLEAADLYRANPSGNTRYLCMSCCFLSDMEDEEEKKLSYLKEGELALGEVEEKEREAVTAEVYRRLGMVSVNKRDFVEADSYFEKMMELKGKRTAVAYAMLMSGICHISLNDPEKAVERLNQAVAQYEGLGVDRHYNELAACDAYLALACAVKEEPDEELVMEYIEHSLSWYQNLNQINNIDLMWRESLKPVMQTAYMLIYPEDNDFEYWYLMHSILKVPYTYKWEEDEHIHEYFED